MEDNGVSFKKTVSKFDEIFKKANNIKQNIVEEIEKINNSYIKVMNDISASFKKQHLLLEEKENKLKSELDLKVTEIKNELEKSLVEYNLILISYERTSKAIKNYEKKNNTSQIKTLSFISELHKNCEKAKNIFAKQIKNIDIHLGLISDTIYYEDYYFNGIPIPKNIKVEKKDNQVYIYWDIGNYRIKDYDINKINYSIKLEGKDNYTIYKTFEKYLLLDKNECKKNIDYSVQIRAVIDDSYGEWSEIKKFKFAELPEYGNKLFGKYFDNDNGNNKQAGGLF